MQKDNNIAAITKRKTLKDFIPMVIAFYLCTWVLAFYQHIRLYMDGVLDGFLNKSLILLGVHHLGFTALLAIVLVFLFNFLERKKMGWGYVAAKIVFALLILVEGALTEHYIQNYEAMGYGMFNYKEVIRSGFSILPILITISATIYLFFQVEKMSRIFYRAVSRMYPFTIVLFSIFLAILNSEKRPVNENKTQHYLQSTADYFFDFNKYDGEAEYPFVRPYESIGSLNEHFALGAVKPNIVIVIVDGLGSDFLGEQAIYGGFTPYLNSISKKSLFWENSISNTGKSFAALPTIMGSLPFGQHGFTNAPTHVNRLSLFSVLKENGYTTSFNYGGNSALNGFDRFLDEERVDAILDKKGFGQGYSLQEEDLAGVSLGYPDKELFRKWLGLIKAEHKPRLDVFLTLSSKKPYLIPESTKYEDRVAAVLANIEMEERTQKIVRRNKEVFASLIYADEAIKEFMERYNPKNGSENTIFVITGSHNVKDLPQENDLDRYRVPFMIYSPLLEKPLRIPSLVSHADIAPTLLGLLDQNYKMEIPQQVAWIGGAMTTKGIFEQAKEIPLFRDKNSIKDFVKGNLFLSDGRVYAMDNTLNLKKSYDDLKNDEVKTMFRSFKAKNKYVIAQNRLIPKEEALYSNQKHSFAKTELVWVESVFNGSDFDNAYKTARKLAFEKEWDRSLLLCRYILNKIPRHADTEVLIGRIYSWKKEYATSADVLNEVVRKYPNYTDAYAALLDTYFWANENEKAIPLFKTIRRNSIFSKQIDEKVTRAKVQIEKNKDTITNDQQNITAEMVTKT